MPSDSDKMLGVFPRAFDIDAVKSDSVDMAINALSIWVGVAGAVKVTTVDGDTVTFTGCQAGTRIPIKVKRVWVTGTVATSLLGLYNMTI